jgi:hypothetical protein
VARFEGARIAGLDRVQRHAVELQYSQVRAKVPSCQDGRHGTAIGQGHFNAVFVPERMRRRDHHAGLPDDATGGKAVPPVHRDNTLANALGDSRQVGGKFLQGISAGGWGFHVMTPAIR